MAEPSPTERRLQPATITLAVAGVLAASAGIYALFFRGDDSAEPPAATAAEAPQAGTIEEMIARIEARIRQNPDVANDWRMLGWTYFELARQARSDDAFRLAMTRAAAAYRRAAELEPNNAENWSSLGEALQVAMTEASPEAERAFARALQLAPQDPRARYFTALQKNLRGRHGEAIDDWIALLRDTPPGAIWEENLRRIIAQVAQQHGIDVAGRVPPARPVPADTATAAIPGPTPEQMAEASSVPPSRQNAMVRDMVEGLAERLRRNPRDADGWIRLMRSRMVLNDPRAARQALDSALAAFQGDAATQARLRDAARTLGVP